MFRLFENSHEDGIDITSNTFKTVNPRELVLQIQRVRGPAFDQRNTHNDFATFYGQIVTHDMMKTLKSQYAVDGGGFYCCNPKQDPKLDDLIRKNPHCMPISVNPRDPHFSGCGMQCMNYIRNLKVLKNCAVDSDASPVRAGNFRLKEYIFQRFPINNSSSIPTLRCWTSNSFITKEHLNI